MSRNKKDLGDWGEAYTIKKIKKLGWKFISQNYRNRFGEIDIIAKDNDCLVFIEVKTRTSNLFGQAQESITAYKKRNLIKTTQFYLKNNNLLESDFRIDLATLDKDQNGSWHFNIIHNAVNYF